MRYLRSSLLAAVVAALALAAAACGGDDDASGAATTGGPSAEGPAITIGYSAWPGWFPLKVAEEKGFFAQAGVNVELRYFTDYIASLDAFTAGQLDGNTQTLNDTIAGMSAGAKAAIVVNTDFSAGNDAIIVDRSIDSIADLKGKTVAAEAGVVDHFLLLQGLESEGLSEKDIDFRGVLTDAAAAGFAAGQFDAVGVFAPFTLEALKRPGSKVLFDSADFPGSISDHIVLSSDLVAERPDDVQRIVDAWYATLDWIAANPDEAREIMAAQAGITAADYASFAEGTRLLDPDEALAAFTDDDKPTSLPSTARKINPFLVSSGLTREEADVTGLFHPEFTQAHVAGAG
ncbi:MAG: ABC transporter substrate-binding protein [Thermoleophilia bacterium]